VKNHKLNSLGWLALVGLISLLLCAPFFRVIYDLPDEGIFLRGAEMILQGKRLYGDFFGFLPPGSYLITAAAFGIGGSSIESARLLAILTILGIACFTFLGCRQVSRTAPLSALLVSGWVMMTQWHFLQVSHHWFTTFFSMAAAWVAFASQEQTDRRSLRWPILAGMAAGAATMCTPTCGAWAMLAAATAFIGVKEARKELIAFFSGSALVFVANFVLVIKQHTLAEAFDDVIRFPISHYASIQYVPFDYGAAMFDLPLKYVFPLLAFLFLFEIVRDWRSCLRDRRLRLCAAFALAGLLACFPRPDSAHVAYAIPLALPLLALRSVQLTASLRPLFRCTLIAGVILLCVPSAFAFAFVARTAHQAPLIQTARGRAAFLYFTNGMPDILPILATTAPKGAFFFYPHSPMLSFLAAREHVSQYDIFIPWYTTPAQYQDACLSVLRDASWVVMDRRFSDYSFWKRTYPSIPNAKPLETIRFEGVLERAFQRVTVKGTLDLRRRREGVTASVCRDIAETGLRQN